MDSSPEASSAPTRGRRRALAGHDLARAVERVLGPGARLRDAQHDALAGLADADTLLVARSGAGKTAVYAVATLLQQRLTIVVSPLLALQRDQVDSLTDAGLRAAAVSSAVPAAERRRVLERARRGTLDVVLLAPEQLGRPDVLGALARADVGLLVVDEAHCVSEWGHDFRPDYRHLAAAVGALGSPRVLALTATASPRVRADIVAGLDLAPREAGGPPRVLVHDADRPEIWLGARVVADAQARDAAAVEATVSTAGAAIVYARTRAEVHRLAGALAAAGRPALAYHAGLPAAERGRVEREFLGGSHDLVVATSAFGMGVDRADVRLVVHAGAPPSLDAYYQEVGRAGRDGEAAVALLVHHPQEVALNKYLRAGGAPRASSVRSVLAAVDGGASRAEVGRRAGLAPRTVARVLADLAEVGVVREDGGRWWPAGTAGGRDQRGTTAATALALVREAHERRRAVERSRVELVATYAQTTDCRRRLLLELLGEDHPGPCGACDSCDAGTSRPVGEARFPVGTRVVHERWGEGSVAVVEADRVTVLFDAQGYVTLDTAVAADSGLLRRAAG